MKISRFMLSTHQGVGLLIGIQVVLWVSGGLVMSALPLAKVRGEDRIAAQTPAPLSPDIALRAPDQLARQLDLTGLVYAELDTWLGRPVYRLRADDGEHLVAAGSGELLSPLDADQARAVATGDYAGPGTVAEVHWLTEPRAEIRGRALPLWQVDIDDSRQTTIYISPRTGKVVGRRNTIWRVYDFFWMLHIMDYRARENFNHPLLVAAAITAWLLATSGLWLVAVWLKRRLRRRRA